MFPAGSLNQATVALFIIVPAHKLLRPLAGHDRLKLAIEL
jgi:hypothetical protein